MAIQIRDDMDRVLVFPHPPRRIVSLVPSDTDSLFALGAGDRLLGRTRYCVEPAGQVDDIPTVGGTKDVDVGAVLALAPDLVIANQEENARPALEEIAQRGVTTLVSFPKRVADGIAHLARLARVLGVEREPGARELIRRGYELLRQPLPDRSFTVFLPIWMEPLMTLSGDTFGSDALALAGGRNVFEDRERRYPLAADVGKAPAKGAEEIIGRDTRYPRITLDEVTERAPELVLLPNEPHEFSEADAEVFRGLDIPACTNADGIRFCDGRDLFWYGARSVEGIPRLRRLVSR